MNTLWREIKDAPLDDEEIIVGWDSATVWITRGAFYCDGADWMHQDFDSQEEARGWWSYRNSVSQEKVEPTHWLPMPEPPEYEPR